MLMELILKHGKVYQNHGFARKDVRIREGKIIEVGENLDISASPSAITPSAITSSDVKVQVIDVRGLSVIPGLIDIHTHGAVGVDVNSAKAEDFEKICRFQASQGVTGWQASILTDTKEQTLWAIGEYRRWKQLSHQGATLIGIHLEGPFLAKEYKGAMPEHLLKTPDLELLKEYQESAGGDIRYITVSPEVEGVVEAIPRMKKMGMAVGHSGADYETARRAIANGATSATHVGNAMRLLHQHEPAIFGAVLEDQDVYAEMICDGRHLHPGTVRFILKAKGTEHVVAITDSIMAGGLPDGFYHLGVNEVVVKDGDAKLVSDGTRAGSTLTAIHAIQNLVQFTGKSLAEIVPLMTENPAKLIGIYDRTGSIAPQKDADLTILDENLEVVYTIARGNLCYSRGNQTENRTEN